VDKEHAPDRTTTTHEPPTSRKTSNWNSAFKRFAIALAFFVAALVAIVTALAHVNPSLLARVLATFAAWSVAEQSVAVLAALIVIGALAGWKQFYQTVQDRQQQTIFTRAVEDGVKGVESLLASINGLLASKLTRDSPVSLRPSKSQPIMKSVPDPPDFKVTSQVTIRKPHDDAQLTPPDIFIGRTDELQWLIERLSSHQRDRDTTVIVGITGIGKTALAAVAIDAIKDQHKRFTDGIARVPCAEKHNSVEVVRHALERVDPGRRVPATLELDVLQQVSEELLAGKDILIVLDGVGPNILLGDVVRALRTQDRSAHLLITTSVTPSVDVALPESQLHLKPLKVVQNPDGSETDEALELFARYAGKKSALEFGEDVAAARAIVEALERHTYSLQLVGGFLQVQGDIVPSLSTGIKSLKNGEVPPGIDTVLLPVWVAHTTTVDALPDEARRLLFAFGAFGTEEAGRRAVYVLGERLSLLDTHGAIHILVRHQLMESFHIATMPDGSDSHRLRVHTLLHAYIAKRVGAPEWAEHYARAKDIIAEHYAEFVPQYDQHDPTRRAQRALTADSENIVRALDWAIDHRKHVVVATLAHAMRRFWHDRWLNENTLRYMATAVESAEWLANEARLVRDSSREKMYLEREADLAFTLGRVLRRTGSLAEAEPLFQRDLEFRRRRKPRDYAAEAQALHQLAQLERSRGRMRLALRYCRQGLSVVHRRSGLWLRRANQMDDSLAQANGLLLAQQGRIERSRGNLKRADILFIEALALFEQTGDLLEQGVAWGYRGRIARVLGDLPTAQEYFERSNELARQVYDFRGQGIIATQLGRIARTRGDIDAAEQAFTEGLKKARQVLDRQAEAVNLNYLGRIARSRGRDVEAEEYFKRSLQIAQEIGDRVDEGMNEGYLGRIALERGFLPRARERFAESLKILREVQDRRGQGLVLANLAVADIKSRRFLWARWRLWRSLRLIRKVGDKRSEGTVRAFLGQLYFSKRNLRAARVQFTMALECARPVEDRSGMAEAQQWLDKVARASDGTRQQ
jgi:tetratricopeptide (TPR) repeat protein